MSADEKDSRCPAQDCRRETACRPPAPACPHPFYGGAPGSWAVPEEPSAPISLLGSLASGSEDAGDLSPGAPDDPKGGDLSGDVVIDVAATGDEGLEAGLGSVHASRLVDTTSERQELLTSIPSVGLGVRIERLLAEHWPNSGVNAWYLADLIRSDVRADPHADDRNEES